MIAIVDLVNRTIHERFLDGLSCEKVEEIFTITFYLNEEDTKQIKELCRTTFAALAIQKEAFEEWYRDKLLTPDSSCMIRDILRNQKKNLYREWMAVRPMDDGNEYERDNDHRVAYLKITPVTIMSRPTIPDVV